MNCTGHFFFLRETSIRDLDLDHDLGTKGKILPQQIHMLNKYDLPFKSYDQYKFICRRTDKEPGQKLYAPDLLMRGHKKP